MTNEPHEIDWLENELAIVPTTRMEKAVKSSMGKDGAVEVEAILEGLERFRVRLLNDSAHAPAEDMAHLGMLLRENQSARSELLSRVQAMETGQVAKSAALQTKITAIATVILAIATIALIFATLNA